MNQKRKVKRDVGNMAITVDKYSTEWNNYIPQGAKDELSLEIKRILQNKTYWSVCCKPNAAQQGSTVYMFIDAGTGEVLAYFYGA